MADPKVFEVKVLNFDDHNQKMTGKPSPWFRCQARLARSPRFLSLSSGAKHLWLWLLCESCSSSTRVVHLRARSVAPEVHVRAHRIAGALQELASIQWIQILTPEKTAYDTNERTNDTNERTYTHKIPASAETPPAEPEQTKLKISGSESKPKKPEPAGTNHLIARYCELWKATHRGTAPIVGKDAGIFKRLLGSLSADKLETYLEAYFEMPDPWLTKVKHPVEIFESRLKEIASFATSGNFISRKQVSQAENTTQTKSQLQRIREGKL